MQGKSITKKLLPFRGTFKKDLCSIPVIADRNSITVLQLNPTGLSNAKQLPLNKFLKDQKPDFVALDETKKQVPENFFTKNRTFSRCRGQNQRGVSLSVPKDTSCCETQEFKKMKSSNLFGVLYNTANNPSLLLPPTYPRGK